LPVDIPVAISLEAFAENEKPRIGTALVKVLTFWWYNEPSTAVVNDTDEVHLEFLNNRDEHFWDLTVIFRIGG
jgi:hypothetical protein